MQKGAHYGPPGAAAPSKPSSFSWFNKVSPQQQNSAAMMSTAASSAREFAAATASSSSSSSSSSAAKTNTSENKEKTEKKQKAKIVSDDDDNAPAPKQNGHAKPQQQNNKTAEAVKPPTAAATTAAAALAAQNANAKQHPATPHETAEAGDGFFSRAGMKTLDYLLPKLEQWVPQGAKARQFKQALLDDNERKRTHDNLRQFSTTLTAFVTKLNKVDAAVLQLSKMTQRAMDNVAKGKPATKGMDRDKQDDDDHPRASESKREAMQDMFKHVKAVLHDRWGDCEADEDDVQRIMDQISLMSDSIARMTKDINFVHQNDQYTVQFDVTQVLCWVGRQRVYAAGTITMNYSRVYGTFTLEIDLKPTGNVFTSEPLKEGTQKLTGEEIIARVADSQRKFTEAQMSQLLQAGIDSLGHFRDAYELFLFGDKRAKEGDPKRRGARDLLENASYNAFTVLPAYWIVLASTRCSLGTDTDETAMFADDFFNQCLTEVHRGAYVVSSIDTAELVAEGAVDGEEEDEVDKIRREKKKAKARAKKCVDIEAVDDDDDDEKPSKRGEKRKAGRDDDTATKSDDEFIAGDDEGEESDSEGDEEEEEAKEPAKKKKKVLRKEDPSPAASPAPARKKTVSMQEEPEVIKLSDSDDDGAAKKKKSNESMAEHKVDDGFDMGARLAQHEQDDEEGNGLFATGETTQNAPAQEMQD
jgi:hypothetical protein